MRKRGILRVLFIVIGLSTMFSCSKFGRLQKNTDWKVRLKGAMEYYEKEDYYRAGVLFDQVIPIIRGTMDAEKATFYRANAYFNQKQYILSSSYYEDFANVYSRSKWAEEAAFMHAKSLYLQSPDYNLDQSATVQAIDAFQNFLNKHAYSNFAKEGTELIDELQEKLGKKAYENALLYYKIKKYKAAIIAFSSFLTDFSDSKYVEEVRYLKISASIKYAQNSLPSKQEERFRDTIELYETFVDRYPESEFLEKAEDLYVASVKNLEKLTKEKQEYGS